MNPLERILRQSEEGEQPAVDEQALWEAIRVDPADAWRAARDEATRAYDWWDETGDAEAFAVYRAAQDRADKAQDELASASR